MQSIDSKFNRAPLVGFAAARMVAGCWLLELLKWASRGAVGEDMAPPLIGGKRAASFWLEGARFAERSRFRFQFLPASRGACAQTEWVSITGGGLRQFQLDAHLYLFIVSLI